jgi:DNA-binding protein WhiA
MASFCIEQKEELTSQLPKNGCCRRAFLHGVLAVRGECADNTVSLSLDNQKISEVMRSLISEFFGKEAYYLPKRQGERGASIAFQSPSAVRYIREIIDHEHMAPMPKCHACAACFLQGIFVGCGRLSSPQKQYCLELLPKTRENSLISYLADIGIEMKRSLRGDSTVLYLKRSEDIEDFFAIAMMNATAFRMMNAKIEGDIRNTANRVANCETNNIEKAVAASARHITAIENLESRGLLSSLSEELEKTARLRLEYRDLSLSQLAALAVPPITKPGLSHRLNRIVAIANRLLGEEMNEDK